MPCLPKVVGSEHVGAGRALSRRKNRELSRDANSAGNGHRAVRVSAPKLPRSAGGSPVGISRQHQPG